MPWKTATPMSLRQEFISLASQEGSNLQPLCRGFGISRKTGYKWLGRVRSGFDNPLEDRSRRPHQSPYRTDSSMEQRIVDLRREHPAWGGRKLHAFLERQGLSGIPSASTITAILHRHGLIDPSASLQHQAFVRFEHAAPNDLLQMDFKGHFALGCASGSLRCHPLTVLDDHSRFALVLKACTNERQETVQAHLTESFRQYGLPDRMTMDNGSPWGSDDEHPYTPLTVWLMRLGIGVSHSRPYHPQTQGKDERFHRTLKAEVIQYLGARSLEGCQEAFDRWRDCYNLERPHEALGNHVPAERYRRSCREYPEVLPAIEYALDDVVRTVQDRGRVSFQGHLLKVSKAFKGYPVAFRPMTTDGCYAIYFCNRRIKEIDLRELTK
jgi:transposase InsO family protein